jgi:hypothetical protein
MCQRVIHDEHRDPRNRLVENVYAPSAIYAPAADELQASGLAHLGYAPGRFGEKLTVHPPVALDPEQPYLMLPSGFPSLLHSIPYSIYYSPLYFPPRRRIDWAFWALKRAKAGQPCKHDVPSVAYRVGDSPMFFACEAQALLGAEQAAKFFERTAREMQVVRDLETCEWIFKSMERPRGWQANLKWQWRKLQARLKFPRLIAAYIQLAGPLLTKAEWQAYKTFTPSPPTVSPGWVRVV